MKGSEAVIRILFLCHGNICRSPMAEFVMKDLVRKEGLQDIIQVESAALHTDEIGSDTHPGTKHILDKYEIPYTPREARLVHVTDYDRFDYLIGMDHYNRDDMLFLFKRDPQHKTSLMLDWVGIDRDVADPWYTGDFDATYDDIEAGCIALLTHIKQGLHR